MVRHGTRPTKRDTRDYSFHRTFGAITNFPLEFNTDAGLTMPNQEEVNALFFPPVPAYPYGCTDYTQTELCIDEDKVLYRPDFTESKTGANAKHGLDIRVSLGSICNDGVQKDGESAELAITHKRSAYFNVQATTDFFDGIRSAIWSSARSVSIGTPWFPEWSRPVNGVVPHIVVYSGYPNEYSWHNWKICGWKMIDGEPYLIGKTWQGREYGDKGFAYFSCETINTVMQIPGTAAFTVAPTDITDIKTIRIGLYERLVYLYQQIIALLS